MIFLKTKAEIETMRTANRIVAEVLAELQQRVRPGVTTAELDRLAGEMIVQHKAETAFKGYTIRNGSVPFPAHVCISLNHEIVHGIPSPQRVIKDGDVVSLDFGVVYGGFYGDAAVSFGVGEIDGSVRQLLDTTAGSLHAGIAQACAGNRLGDVSAAVQSHVERAGYSVVREFVGHGVGRKLHEDPPVPNYGVPNRGVRLREGMVIAIEPMVNMGGAGVAMLDDGWTAVTKDGSLSAHFEHSVAVTTDGPVVLSRL